MVVEPEVVAERLKRLGEYIADLEEVSGATWEEFRDNKVLRRYVERTLQLAVECCLDVGSHIISSERLREPEDNKDVFKVLVEAGFLPEEMLGSLQRMAGFRNILIHEYTRIDPEAVFGVLKRRLDDLRRFVREIARRVPLR